jgi:hypothetical protein
MKNRAIKAAVALALMFGAALSPASAYTYTGAEVISAHAHWQSFLVRVDGELATGVSTTMDGGGQVSFLVRPHHFLILADDPKWRLKKGAEMKMTVRLEDGTSFSGQATAVDPNELAIEGNDQELLKGLIDGQRVSLEFDGITWDLSLDGFDASLKEGLDAYGKTTI